MSDFVYITIIDFNDGTDPMLIIDDSPPTIATLEACTGAAWLVIWTVTTKKIPYEDYYGAATTVTLDVGGKEYTPEYSPGAGAHTYTLEEPPTELIDITVTLSYTDGDATREATAGFPHQFSFTWDSVAEDDAVLICRGGGNLDEDGGLISDYRQALSALCAADRLSCWDHSDGSKYVVSGNDVLKYDSSANLLWTASLGYALESLAWRGPGRGIVGKVGTTIVLLYPSGALEQQIAVDYGPVGGTGTLSPLVISDVGSDLAGNIYYVRETKLSRGDGYQNWGIDFFKNSSPKSVSGYAGAELQLAPEVMRKSLCVADSGGAFVLISFPDYSGETPTTKTRLYDDRGNNVTIDKSYDYMAAGYNAEWGVVAATNNLDATTTTARYALNGYRQWSVAGSTPLTGVDVVRGKPSDLVDTFKDVFDDAGYSIETLELANKYRMTAVCSCEGISVTISAGVACTEIILPLIESEHNVAVDSSHDGVSTLTMPLITSTHTPQVERLDLSYDAPSSSPFTSDYWASGANVTVSGDTITATGGTYGNMPSGLALVKVWATPGDAVYAEVQVTFSGSFGVIFYSDSGYPAWELTNTGATYGTDMGSSNIGFSSGDVVQIAFDGDSKVWFGVNGTWANSGNPATGANPTAFKSGSEFEGNIIIRLDMSSGDEGVGHFFATEMVYTMPTGFIAWAESNYPVIAYTPEIVSTHIMQIDALHMGYIFEVQVESEHNIGFDYSSSGVQTVAMPLIESEHGPSSGYFVSGGVVTLTTALTLAMPLIESEHVLGLAPDYILPMPLIESEHALGLSIDYSLPMPLITSTHGFIVAWSVISGSYSCVLTGGLDGLTNVTIPISSFQSRLRDGDPSYLSVVVPNGPKWLGYITDRPNGEIIVYQGTHLLARGSYDYISYNEGAKNSSIQLTGYSTVSSTAPKTVALQHTSVVALQRTGAKRITAAVDFNARPGDTVTWDGGSMTAGMIALAVSTRQGTMTVTEAEI